MRVINKTRISINFSTHAFLDDLTRIRRLVTEMDIIAEFESLGNGNTIPLKSHEITKRHLLESRLAILDQMVIFIPDSKY